MKFRSRLDISIKSTNAKIKYSTFWEKINFKLKFYIKINYYLKCEDKIKTYSEVQKPISFISLLWRYY